MRIALYHGYELHGSGSNEYVRYLSRTLARQGHDVHVICADPNPEAYDFVTEAYAYDSRGRYTQLFQRAVETPGAAIVHRLPDLPVYPVYLTDKQRSHQAKAFTELSDRELRDYHNTMVTVVSKILQRIQVDILQANHLVYQPVVAREACSWSGTPYVIFPHGSSIEYTVRKQQRYRDAAAFALEECDALICGSREVEKRIDELFPLLHSRLAPKRSIVGVGVDTELFAPIATTERREVIRTLARRLGSTGKRRKQTDALYQALESGDFGAVRRYWDAYDHQLPDEGLDQRLLCLPAEAKIVLYVGGLTVGKGVQSLITAFPGLVAKQPEAQLVIVGNGAYREVLEGLVYAIDTGNEKLLEHLAQSGCDLDRNEQTGAWQDVEAFLAKDENRRQLLQHGARLRERVIFTGRLSHEQLRLLYPCASLAVFPSIVAEAYPLVLLESFANGVLPMVTYDSGFRDGLESVRDELPAMLWPKLQIDPAPAARIESLQRHASELLSLLESTDVSKQLREIAVRRFDWEHVGKRMTSALRQVLERKGRPVA